jgi:hypothetical protein
VQLFRSRPFAIALVVLLILGLAGAGIATLIPGRSQAPVVDADALWAAQPEEVKTEVCTAFRANPQGYTLLMEQTWLQDGSLDQASFDRLVDVIATDCRINF